MNGTVFPFFRGALAMALVLIPVASFMPGCMQDTNLTGGNDSTAGAGAGSMAGSGGSGGGMGGSGGGGVSKGLWSKRFGSGGSDLCSSPAVDNAGNLVFIGSFASTIDFGGGPLMNPNESNGSDLFLTKFDSSGSHLWSKSFGTVASVIPSLAVNSVGDVAIVGGFTNTVDFGGGLFTAVGGDDAFVAKFDPNGNHVWSKRFGDVSDDDSGAVALDNAGNVAIAGTFKGTVDLGGGLLTAAGGDDVFVAKFDTNGNHVWSKRFGDASNDSFVHMVVDSAGNILLDGNFSGQVDFGGGPLTSAGGDDIYVAKFDANGNHVWSKRFGDTGDQRARRMAIDSADNVVLSGPFSGAVDFGGGSLMSAGDKDIYVAKLDQDSNHVWSKRFGGVGADSAGVAIDSAGNIVLGGSFFGPVDFGGGPLTSPDQNAFVAKFDPSCNHLWSVGFGDQGDQMPATPTIDSAGNVLVAGIFQNTIDFGNGPLVSAGIWDIFLAKLTP